MIGLACDLEAGQMHVSVNGSFDAPHGVAFQLPINSDGLFPAFTGGGAVVMKWNFGEGSFRHAPPSDDFVSFEHLRVAQPSTWPDH